MPLIYITGIAAAGKTTAVNELKERGFEAYDMDSDGFGTFVNIDTGKRVPFPLDVVRRTKEFSANHFWHYIGEKVIQLSQDAKYKTVFLGGLAYNQADYYSYFDKMIYLEISDPTIERRVKTRTTNIWGKQPHELELILAWHEKSRELAREAGMAFIDAEQPLDKVVDEILDITGLK